VIKTNRFVLRTHHEKNGESFGYFHARGGNNISIKRYPEVNSHVDFALADHVAEEVPSTCIDLNNLDIKKYVIRYCFLTVPPHMLDAIVKKTYPGVFSADGDKQTSE
jgi:hypothetical protein